MALNRIGPLVNRTRKLLVHVNTFWCCDISKFKNFNTKSNCHLKYEVLSSEYNYFQHTLTWLDQSKTHVK